MLLEIIIGTRAFIQKPLDATICGAVLLLLNYLFFCSASQYQKIVVRYSSASDEDHRRGWRRTLTYMLVSVSLVFVIGFVKGWLAH
jgi:hypothetical protein